MQTWNNGAKAQVVKKVIEQNFNVLSKHLSQNILSLSTQEREILGQEYLSIGLRCYDTTLNRWFVYDGMNWAEWEQEYTKQILVNEWINNSITIPYSSHLRRNPVVQLFILDSTIYSPVCGGVSVDSSFNVILSTDLPFEGKVVIK